MKSQKKLEHEGHTPAICPTTGNEVITRSVRNFYETLDYYRRWRGLMMDSIGTGYIATPFRAALTRPELTLRAYDTDSSPVSTEQPVLLIVPAPIKSALIWDLAPDVSVVQRCHQHGVRVYMIQWKQPGTNGNGCGLAAYADRFILECIEAIATETGQSRVFLAGHSSGGIFSAIFAALHPDMVQGLLLAGTPLSFGPDSGAVSRRVASAPDARTATAHLGNIPGSFLNRESVGADRQAFANAHWIDWMQSVGNYDAMLTHLRVRRWTLDEMPMASQLFEEIIEWLYREDRFMRGTLYVGDRHAAPHHITAPVLSMVDKQCSIVPPQTVLPFHEAVQSSDTRLLWYGGDTGVALQHVGFLVGRNAHQHLWPEAIQWMYAHWNSGQAGHAATRATSE